MASRKEPTRGRVDIALEASPDTVDAGAELTLHARVSCSPPCDFTGHRLLVKDNKGLDVAALELTDFDDDENAIGAAALQAPLKTGDYVWSILSPAVVKEGVSYEEASKPISFTSATTKVTPNPTRAISSASRFART